MKKPRRLLRSCIALKRRLPILLACPALAAAGAGVAADYPVRPIRFVVPFAAGGTSDIIGRILSARMQETLGQSLVVDNRGGAGGTIGTDIVAKATPDGYTIVLASNGTHAIVPYQIGRASCRE